MLHAFKQTFWITVLTFCLVWLVGYIATILLPLQHEYQGYPWLQAGDFWINVKYTWDTLFFTRIAEGGYVTGLDHVGNLDYLRAFFPLFPLILALFVPLSPLSYLLVCFLLIWSLASGVYAFLNLSEVSTAGSHQYWFVFLIFPFGIFFFIPYTESLFALLMVMILVQLYKPSDSLEKMRWLLLVLGILLGLTRSVSLFFSISLVASIVYRSWLHKRFEWNFILRVISVVLGVLVGVGSIFAYHFYTTRSWTVVLDVQAYWGRSVEGGKIFDVLARAVQESFSGNISFTLLFVLLFFLTLFASLVIFSKQKNRVGFELVLISFVFAALTLFSSLSQNTLQSANRYLLVTPFVLLGAPLLISAILGSKWNNLVYWYCLSGLIFLLLTTVLFFRHYWVG
jgi:hypothetical protein